MLTIGSHLSSSKGYLAMGMEAVRIGANTFQFFLRNPRGGKAKELNPEDIAHFNGYAREHSLGPIMAHASYVLNPATADPKLQKFVRETIIDDLARLEHTPGNLYNIHPGGHGGRGVEAGIKAVAEMLDQAIDPGISSTFLLETMSGSGNELGGTFENLRAIIDASKRNKLLGVCLDTCHVLTAGYDIVNDLDSVLQHFDKVVGLKRLKAIHLNDSMFPLGSHKDRHAKIGEGEIGMKGFARIINHPALRELPFYLETPNDPDGWGREIATLRELYKDTGKKAAGTKPPAKPGPGKKASPKASAEKPAKKPPAKKAAPAASGKKTKDTKK